MCQKPNLHSSNPLKQAIIFTDKNILAFAPVIVGVHEHVIIDEVEALYDVISTGVSDRHFQRFARYCHDFNLICPLTAQCYCDLNTIRSLYEEFRDLEFNLAITGLLKKNNIEATATLVCAVEKENESVVGSLSWMERVRVLMQSRLQRIINNQAGQDK